jgi:hypothetical protein
MKTYWGSADIAPRILGLGTMEIGGQLYAPAALPAGIEPPVPIG